MADFVAVLTKTIDGLGPRNTADMRQKVYERANKAIADKLAAVSPAPTPEQSARQYKMLEDAVRTVEARYAPPAATSAPSPTTTAVPLAAAAPAAEVPSAAPMVSTTTPPRPDRDPLEDFLNSVQSEPVKSPVLPKPALETQRSMATPTTPRPSAVTSLDPVLGPDGRRPPFSVPEADVAALKRKSGGGSGLLFGLLGLLAIGGAGYAGYVYKDKLQDLLGMQLTPAEPVKPADPAQPATAETPSATETPAATETPSATEAPAATETPAAEPAKPAADAAPAVAPTPKFTQRLTPEGQEIDAGPGTKPTDVGEGSTVASATTPSAGAPAEPPVPPAAAEVIPVGQKAIFYEEKTGTEAGTADQGAVVWSVVQDSPGVDQPQEPAIRGELTIPGKNIKVRLTIKRNGDKSLPASHIVEMLFSTPPDFAGGAIENVQRMALKDTEQAPGSPLVGVPAAFGDGFFLIALTDEKTAIETNMTLLQRQNWIDIPVAYRSGRRALLSFEKGLAGDKVFKDVFKAWEASGAALPAPAATPG